MRTVALLALADITLSWVATAGAVRDQLEAGSGPAWAAAILLITCGLCMLDTRRRPA